MNEAGVPGKTRDNSELIIFTFSAIFMSGSMQLMAITRELRINLHNSLEKRCWKCSDEQDIPAF